MKIRILPLLILCLGISQNLMAAINWSETVSGLPIAEDFEAYSLGNVSGVLDINVGVVGETFEGQTVDTATGWDVVSGTPNDPLAIAPSTDQIQVYSYSRGNSALGLTSGTVGLGAVSVLFDSDHSEFGLAILGANQGDVTFQFFDRTGASVGTAVVNLTVTDSDFTLTSDGPPFAGVTITNTDLAGITYDDFRVGQAVPSAPPTPVPTLSQWMLIFLAFTLAAIGYFRFRRRA